MDVYKYSLVKESTVGEWYKCRLKGLKNRELRRVFGPKRDEVTWNGENYIMSNLVISTAQ